MSQPMTYADAGVDYDVMDLFKLMAQRAGRKTAGNIARLNNGEFHEFEMSRGESAYLIEAAKSYFAHVEECLDRGIDIHYAVNITGHGWRKLMRADKPFTYVIDRLPNCPPIFKFMQEHGPIDDREAYGNFTMGAGFALYVAPRDIDAVSRAVQAVAMANPSNYHRMLVAGYIEESETKRVVILPKEIEYLAESLAVR